MNIDEDDEKGERKKMKKAKKIKNSHLTAKTNGGIID